MANKFLPVGTVITLKNAKKKLTIVGNAVKKDDGTLFDYIAVPHPEGFIDSETMLLFNFEDINSIDFIGYIDSEAQMFIHKLLNTKSEKNF